MNTSAGERLFLFVMGCLLIVLGIVGWYEFTGWMQAYLIGLGLWGVVICWRQLWWFMGGPK